MFLTTVSLCTGFQGEVVEVDHRKEEDGNDILDYAKEITRARTVPRIWIKGRSIGGHDELVASLLDGTVHKLKQQ